MRMIISGRHLEVTEPIRDYAEKKIGRIKKHFDNILEVDVTLSARSTKDGPRHQADVLVFANGIKIKATAEDKDLYAAIDEVYDVLDVQVTKHKEKLRDNRHSHREKIVAKHSHKMEEGDVETKKIISTKVTSPKFMSVEEAILQMEALEQDFYTFMNHETEELNVVYKRKDGDYGHVEPGWNEE
jgi:putative sigma-54 modulation protein